MINEEDLIKKILPKKETSVDEGFKYWLYQKLEQEFKPKKSFNINNNFMNKFRVAFATGAVALAALLIYINANQNPTQFNMGKQEITKINDHAFGSLAQLTVSGRGGMGGGNSAESDKMMAPGVTSTPGMGMPSDTSMPVYYNYKYVYKGEAFSVESDKMEVFERQKGFGSSANLNNFLSQFNIGMLDLGKFAQAQVNYINATENRDFGYSIGLDMKEGMVKIDQNWERWPNPDVSCVDQACYERNRVKIEQIPADDVVINAANQFLDEYGIDRGSFGTPVVQNMWRGEYERATDKSLVYIPEIVTVVYPIRVSGNELFDESGNKTGLYVSYNVRAGKVSNVNQLTSQRFQGSNYETERDVARLLKVAERGGHFGYYPMPMPLMDAAKSTESTTPQDTSLIYPGPDVPPQNIPTQEIELGKPTTGYVRLWQYTNNQNRELFVPSLIFPVINPPFGYTQNVTVPLIKEILDSQVKGGMGGDDMRIMQ